MGYLENGKEHLRRLSFSSSLFSIQPWFSFYCVTPTYLPATAKVTSVVSNSVRPHRRQPTRPPHLQARTLVWVALSFSNVWNWNVKVKSLSRVRLLATPWTAAYLAPPSMGFSRQEYWSGVPLPSPTYLPTYFRFSPSTLKHIIPPSPQFLANQACWSALLSSCISGLIHFCISLERKVSKCTRR